MRLRRALQRLYQELWQNPLPHGLVSVRYLMPGQDERVRLHRQLWWCGQPSWPRLLWFFTELWLWLRWVLLSGWISISRAIRLWGPSVRDEEELSLGRQFRSLIRLSIGRCIPPRDVYLYRLYRDPERAWDIVFEHEIVAYHRWRSRMLDAGPGSTSRSVLGDKVRLTEVLTTSGIPMAPILAIVPRGDPADLSRWLTGDQQLFCKMRSGNQGRGAFTVWQQQGAMQGRRLSGETLPDAASVSRALQTLLQCDDVLVQPCLRDHSRMAILSEGDEAITIRYVSHRNSEGIRGLAAFLDIPSGRDERTGELLFTTLAIDIASGEIQPLPDSVLLWPVVRERHDETFSRLPSNWVIPDWDVLTKASDKAHGHFPDLWAIAWDWVVTPDGPRLLEGNSGWGGGQIPQLLHGGFLRPRLRLTGHLR